MLITDDTPQIPYTKKETPGKKDFEDTYKDGQRKLLIMEILFLTKYKDIINKVLYIGSAPGHHINTLIKLFPRIQEWHFYDMRETYVESQFPYKRVNKHKFTLEQAEHYKDRGFSLISDIRSYTDDHTGKHPVKIADEVIKRDMKFQYDLVNTGYFNISSLKFRLPWEDPDSSITHAHDGELHTQPWLGEHSPELRLFTDGKSTRDYDHIKIDSQMNWYNTIKRREDVDIGYNIDSYDQYLEYDIIGLHLNTDDSKRIIGMINNLC